MPYLATFVVILVVGLYGELCGGAGRGQPETVAGSHRPRPVGHVGRHNDGEGALPAGPEQPPLVSASLMISEIKNAADEAR